MTANGYKCWAKLCYIIDEVLRVNWSSYSHTGALLSSLRLQKATLWFGTGEARELQTILVFYHLLAVVKWWVSRPCSAVSPQHVLLPLQSFLQANINICGLLYFLSTSSASSSFHLVKNPCIVPRTLTLFQARPKSELPGKQTNKESIFSTALFICFLLYSAHSFGFLIAYSFTYVPNIPNNLKLPPVNQCFTLTCLEHVLTDKEVTKKTNSLDAVE